MKIQIRFFKIILGIWLVNASSAKVINSIVATKMQNYSEYVKKQLQIGHPELLVDGGRDLTIVHKNKEAEDFGRGLIIILEDREA